MIGFITGNWTRLLIYGLVIVGALGTAAGWGYHRGVMQKYEYIAKQATEAVRIVTKIVTLTNTIREPYLVRETEIQRVFYRLEEETEDAPSRPACNATRGWVQRHNAAADGEDRPVSGAMDETTDTDIGETTVQGVVIRNYKAFHQITNDLKACRAFVQGIAQVTMEQ